MNGFSITCASGETCQYAVLMENGSGSRVLNDSSDESVISGAFHTGVNCGLTANSEVSGIRIVDTLVGVNDCKIVENNVITGLGRTYLTLNVGIQTSGVSATGDRIRDNYIADKSFDINILGTDAVKASGNVIHTTGWSNCGVKLYADSEAVIEGNIFLGVGNSGFGTDRKIVCLPDPEPAGVSYSGNICDRDHPDCDECISSGRCLPFEAPFIP